MCGNSLYKVMIDYFNTQFHFNYVHLVYLADINTHCGV